MTVHLAVYAVVLAAIIVLLWPASRAGRAVIAVTGQVSAMLRG